jgi:hypothetical protein
MKFRILHSKKTAKKRAASNEAALLILLNTPD